MSKLGSSIGCGTLARPGSVDFDLPEDFYFGDFGVPEDRLSSISSFSIGFIGVMD